MRHLLILLSILVLSSASSPNEAGVEQNGDFSYELNATGEGIRRFTFGKTKRQFFYFCDIPKNKKKCGAWVDEKGNKIEGANNNVKRTKKGWVLSKMTLKDGGVYTIEPQNPDEQEAELDKIAVHVYPPPPE